MPSLASGPRRSSSYTDAGFPDGGAGFMHVLVYSVQEISAILGPGVNLGSLPAVALGRPAGERRRPRPAPRQVGAAFPTARADYLAGFSPGPACGPPGDFLAGSPSRLFSAPQPGAEKRRSENFVTQHAQESEGIVYGGTPDHLWPRRFLSRVFDREMMSHTRTDWLSVG
jgi:hypothetical protein